MDSTVTWNEGMAFKVDVDGFEMTIDAAPQHGGTGKGPTPKPLMLTALAGCTAMDVIAILGKMRITPSAFSVSADTELTEQHPKVFKEVVLTYRFEGEDLAIDRLKRAVELSETRYCGVNAMVSKATTVRTVVFYNGEQI